MSYPDIDMQLEPSTEKQFEQFLMEQERMLLIFGHVFLGVPPMAPFFLKPPLKQKEGNTSFRLGFFYHTFYALRNWTNTSWSKFFISFDIFC